MNLKSKYLRWALRAVLLLVALGVFHYVAALHAGVLVMAAAPVVITEEQLAEFKTIMAGIKDYAGMFPGLKDLSGIEGGFAKIKEFPALLKSLATDNEQLKTEINRLRKASIARDTGHGVRWIGNVPFVTDDCAKALTSIFVLEVEKLGAMEHLVKDAGMRQRCVDMAKENLNITAQTRAALTTTEIPVPTIYTPQIVELVWKYGQARQFATVFPLGAGTVKLPRLKAGEDDFAYLGAGTAGMSQSVGEKKVTAELVTFTANKAGGLIRIPTELEEDTFIPIGQFLARYIARQMAKLEDKTVFLGDGTSTYGNATGVGPYCAASSNPSYLKQLAAGKTKPSDATLGDFRAMRGLIGDAALNGGNAAYYLRPSFENLLSTFNTSATVIPYRPQQGNMPATLDGFPIRWIGVGTAYGTTAAASGYLAFFGDLSYVYLGERGQVRVEVSKEVFFATDELALRALERIDVEIVGVDAMAALQTAAS